MKRKAHRRKKAHRKNDKKISIAAIIIIILFSITAGYITATYVFAPILGLDAGALSFELIKKDNDKVNDNQKDKENKIKVVQDEINKDNDCGYALQYGSFSSETGAKECMNALAVKGIEARIIQKDGAFKVIGKVFDTKDDARAYRDSVGDIDDVFITEIP